MNPPKIIFFDIDETLYRKTSDYLPPSVIRSIRALKERGIIPAIATGRSICALPEKIRQLIAAENIELLITINGQYNLYQGKSIASRALKCEEIEPFLELFRAHGWAYSFVGDKQMASSADTARVAESLHDIGTYIIDPDYYRKYPVYQLLFYIDAEEEAIFRQTALGSDPRFQMLRWHPLAVDILPAECSKARGIRAVCETLHIPLSATMAFGDGPNDRQMFETVGFAVAMGDAAPALSCLADYRTGTVEEDGIFRALVRLGIIDA